MDYPYQTRFHQFLRQQKLAPLTIKTYDTTITNLFSYLLANRPEFAKHPVLANLTEADVRAYLSFLRTDRRITMTTFNKILSQLNRYFLYLFTHQLINSYPTLTLHGHAVTPNQQVSTKWLAKTLLLSKCGFTVGEFLAPGFYQVWDKLTLSGPGEEEFRQAFNTFIRPQQDLQNSHDLFLKQRFAPANPRLSNAALHKFLKKDEQYLGFSLAPKYLHQSYILLFLAHHRQLSDRDLEDALKLDPASLLYYQRLLLHANQ